MRPTPKVQPIGHVQQNNAMPWLPPIKTLTNLGEDEPAVRRESHNNGSGHVSPAATPEYAGFVHGMNPSVHPGLERMAMAMAASQQQEQAMMYADALAQMQASMEEQAAVASMAQCPATETTNVLYMLQILQREREQLKTQALQNELLMR